MLPSFVQLKADRPLARRIVLYYAVAALAWFLVGDTLVARLPLTATSEWLVLTTQGTLFILLTSALIYRLVAARERELASEKSRLHLVLSQLPALLWTTDRQLRLTSLAGEVERLDFAAEDQVGQGVAVLTPRQQDRLATESNHRQALTGVVADYRSRLGSHEFAVRVEPLYDEARNVAGTVGFALELMPATDREVRSVRDAVRLARTLGALGSLTHDIAHQLKNPLFALSAALDAFEQRTGEEPATARHREIMRQQVVRIERLVSAVQVYGRRLELDCRRTDLVPLLASALGRARPMAEAAGVELVLRAASGQVHASVDHEAIVGAFDRVLRNAVEHSPPGSQVTVAVHASEESGDAVEVSVLDNGQGFADADVEHVFDPLFARRPGGAGLGLAIAARIVEAHDGRISAGNREVGGARVTMWLPAD